MTYFSFIDLTTQVRIEYGNGLTITQYFLYPKNTLAVDVLGDVLTVSETESSQLVVQITYSTDTVLTPSSTDINDLATQLANIFSGTGSGSSVVEVKDGDGDFLAINANGSINVNLPTTTLNLSSYVASTSGNTGGALKSVSFTTSSDFDGTINGAIREPNTTYTFSTDESGSTINDISYLINTGTILIDIIK